jgi:FMN-dependent NADH-azoreductase
LAREVDEADAIILGSPLYNYGAPSTVKTWVDHLMIPGVTFDHDTMQGFLSTPLYVMVARGGGYSEGGPRHGWDHVESWLPHGISLTGLEPRFVSVELTLAHINPEMAKLIPLADKSLADAEAEIDGLFARATA